MVYKLERSLYGLSQSPAFWNDILDESLTVYGWKNDSIRPLRVRVYQRQHHRDSHGLRRRHFITGGDQQLVDQKKKELTDRFEMTDMGEEASSTWPSEHDSSQARGNLVLPFVYKRGQCRLAAFTDSSFGANPDNGRSTTGYLFFLAGGLISYGAKTQTLTAQSTVEAEIQALSYSAREAVYISNFMTELNFKTFGSVPINSDSTGALTVAGNAMHSQRTKHVALRYFFIRELVLRGQITLHHRPSEHQLADIATKYLPKHRFASIIQSIKDFSC
ncbi:unnamed protein product [Ectocarpus sp. CCAP 1310/34]|nr:unnamed protein product [Ectocarpus sp. CCAP 1310/34]